MSEGVLIGEVLAVAEEGVGVLERAKKRRKHEESTPGSSIRVVLGSIAGTQLPEIFMPVGACLGELRSQVAAMISLERGQHFSLVWEECVLPDASFVRLVDIGFVDGIVLVVVKKDVRILTASEDSTAKLWNAITGECLLTFQGHGHPVMSASFSPCGTSVLTVSVDLTACLWSTATGQRLQTFSGHTALISSAVFSSDGAFVLTASHDNTARLWSVATGECLQTFIGHTDFVISAVFSSESDSVLTASHDNMAKLWIVAMGECSGECSQTFVGHMIMVVSASVHRTVLLY